MLIFRDEARSDAMRPACEGVLQNFDLPSQSLLCIFDDQERSGFLQHQELGQNFCGFFLPVRRFGIGHGIWAPELVAHIWDDEQVQFVCDSVIYLRKRTCAAPIGMVITFAHELQHFIQYGHHYQAWKSQRCIQHVAAPKLHNPRPWDFPAEHEAQLVSKRVAEQIVGAKEVRQYAQERINADDDAEKWQFFLGLDATSDFDFLQQTASWIAKYQQELSLHCPDLIR